MDPIINPSTLTEEQRKMIKVAYATYKYWHNQYDYSEGFGRGCSKGAMNALETLFGKEIFEEDKK